MSALYGSMESDTTRSGPRTCGGHKQIEAHIRGWDFGVMVQVIHGESGDYARIFLTGGSHRTGADKLLGEYTRIEYDELA